MGNKDAGNLSMQESVSPAQNEMYADFIVKYMGNFQEDLGDCLLYTSPSPRDA